MKRVCSLVVLGYLMISPSVFSQNIYSRTSVAGGVLVGYNNGIGFQGSLLLKNFADGLPVNLKIGLGLSFLNPGKSAEARKIFINDATNGVPEKAGRLIDFRADFLYNIIAKTYLYIGPRFSMFTGNFNYVGGNEDFDITSNQWGAGLGVENYFRISPALDLVFNLGYDYFFTNTLYGHDTSYSPDNENVNDREGFTFQDADDAINQPKYSLKAMVGLNYNF